MGILTLGAYVYWMLPYTSPTEPFNSWHSPLCSCAMEMNSSIGKAMTIFRIFCINIASKCVELIKICSFSIKKNEIKLKDK